MTVKIKNAQVNNLHIGPRIISDGLISYWNATSPYSYPRTGSVWYDLVRNNDGSMVNMNSTNFSEDGGGSLVFDGTDEYVSIPDDDSLDVGTDSFTVSAWIKPNVGAMVVNSTIATKGGTAVYPRWKMEINKGAVSWRIANCYISSSSTSLGITNGAIYYSHDTWHHMVMVYKVNDYVKVYINGAIDSLSSHLGDPIGSISNSHPLEIGGSTILENTATTLYNEFPGSIASVKFYKKYLTDSEVNQDYLSQKGRFGL